MIELLFGMFARTIEPGTEPKLDPDAQQKFNDFWTWLLIFGSDAAIQTWGQFMQTTFAGNPPPAILMRMVANFALEARRDMGDATTRTTPLEVFMPKISDLFGANTDTYDAMTMPLDELYRKYGWTPPWMTARPTR